MHLFETSAGSKAVRGFTLVELLVVLAIIVTITSVVLTSQSSFNKTLILANTAYDVALSLRSAATYGLGGRAISMSPTGYGMHFELSTPGSFTLFADTYPPPSALSCHPAGDQTTLDAQPGNCSYEFGQDETIMVYTLGNNITIGKFCASAAGAWSCTSDVDGLTALDIVFARPDADPFMSINRAYSTLSPVTNACLTISSPLGGERYVAVSSTGRITANATSCP